MNDLLKKILDQTKQADIYDPSFYQTKQIPTNPVQENEYLKNPVNIFPIQEPELNYTPVDANKDQIISKMSDKQSQRLKLGMMPEERIVSNPTPAKTDQGLPPTDSEKAMDEIELPEEPRKAPTLEDILAGVKPDNELADAQSANQDFIRNVLLARAANKVGSSIAGVKADDQYGQDLIDYSGKKVSDLQTRKKADVDARNQAINEAKSGLDYKRVAFELGDKEKENDPNSEVSKAFRDYARSYIKMAGANINIDDRLSMADLQKQMGQIGNIVSAKMAQDTRSDNMKLAMAGKEEAKKEKITESRARYANVLNEQLKDVIKIKQNAASLKSAVAQAIKSPSGLADISAVYKFVKMLDTDSAVREGEISLLQSAIPIFDNFKNKVEGQFKGDVNKLSDEAKRSMLNIASEYLKAADNAYNRKLSTKKAIADKLEIPQEFYDPYYNEQINGKSQDQIPNEDSEAVEWAKKNPTNPDAIEILKLNGVK